MSISENQVCEVPLDLADLILNAALVSLMLTAFTSQIVGILIR